MSNSNPPRKVIHIPRMRMVSRGARNSSGIRITNVKAIRPPNPEIVKKNEEEKLRAQLQKEIVSRSRSCAYKRYSCCLPVMWGRQHCARHAAHEPGATTCKHDRCDLPALTDSSENPLCYEHARSALYARQRAAAPAPPVTTTETLLNQLQHYVKAERIRTASSASVVSVVSEPADNDIVTPPAIDPFKQIDATTVNASYSTNIMECASGSDSEADSVTVEAVDADQVSDTEDAPAEDQPLWRAGVYTAEEAVCEAKSALKCLQTAYLGQMNRLRDSLLAARLQYLRTLKAEREQYCSINSQSVSGQLTVRERRQLKKLKCYASYRRKHGVDAVLARKLYHKRAKVKEWGGGRAPPCQGRCIFSEGGVRCAAAVLPATKHCLKHVLNDHQQVLFEPCGDMRGGVPCREPIPRLPLASSACRYHTNPPSYTVFTLKKDDSESDSDTNISVDSQLTVCEDEPMADLAQLAELAELAEPSVV